MMGYKVGDEVMVKAKIVKDCMGVYILKTSEGKYIYDKKENLLPVPDMTAEEAWEIAKNLFANYSNAELDDIFGKGWSFPKLMELTPQEAKAKIEAWESEKDIKVGDIVMNEGLKCVVTRVSQDKVYTISKIGTTPVYCEEHIKKLKKTGRHIDIDGLLKQIGGDE